MFERMKESLATRLVDGPPQTRDHRSGPSGQATPIANRACEWPNTTQCSPFRRCAPFRHRHRLPLVRPPVPHCSTLHQIALNRSDFERPYPSSTESDMLYQTSETFCQTIYGEVKNEKLTATTFPPNLSCSCSRTQAQTLGRTALVSHGRRVLVGEDDVVSENMQRLGIVSAG